MYKKQVNDEFCELELMFKEKKHQWTSCEHVLLYMLEKKDKIWFWAWELSNVRTETGILISHKGSARASDLANFYPKLVEARKISRFCVYRLRLENIKLIKKHLKSYGFI